MDVMRKPHFTLNIVIVISLLLISLVAFNWSSKFFHRDSALLRYGERIPQLEGREYSGRRTLSVSARRPTLIVYLSSGDLRGQSIALLKFCESLRQDNHALVHTTLITAGRLAAAEQLLQDNLISYPIINDSNQVLAKRLGHTPQEAHT